MSDKTREVLEEIREHLTAPTLEERIAKCERNLQVKLSLQLYDRRIDLALAVLQATTGMLNDTSPRKEAVAVLAEFLTNTGEEK